MYKGIYTNERRSADLVLLANHFKFQEPVISMLYKLLQNIKK